MSQDKVQKLLEKSDRPLNSGEMGELLNLSRASITRAVKSLKKQKIVKQKIIVNENKRKVPYYYI